MDEQAIGGINTLCHGNGFNIPDKIDLVRVQRTRVRRIPMQAEGMCACV